MKKHLLLSVIIFLAIVLPALYPRWSTSRRLAKIERIRIEARSNQGSLLSDALDQLSDLKRDDHLTILYTGGTRGHLEPCGCFEGQSGGIARRATAVASLRDAGPQTLLVDAGDIVEGETPLDRRRTATYLAAMSALEYDAVCMRPSELSQLESFPDLPLVLTNQAADDAPEIPLFLIKKVGRIRVGILGVCPLDGEGDIALKPAATSLSTYLPRIKAETDLILLLSQLPEKENHALIGCNRH